MKLQSNPDIRNALWKTGFQSARSGAGERLLLPDWMAKVHPKGVFFYTDTGITTSSHYPKYDDNVFQAFSIPGPETLQKLLSIGLCFSKNCSTSNDNPEGNKFLKKLRKLFSSLGLWQNFGYSIYIYIYIYTEVHLVPLNVPVLFPYSVFRFFSSVFRYLHH